jgi:hypothetical protein
MSGTPRWQLHERAKKPICMPVWLCSPERFSRVEQLEHRVPMLLGIFSAKGVLPLEFKPAHSVGDLLTQHLDELEQEADRKGGITQILEGRFARTF